MHNICSNCSVSQRVFRTTWCLLPSTFANFYLFCWFWETFRGLIRLTSLLGLIRPSSSKGPSGRIICIKKKRIHDKCVHLYQKSEICVFNLWWPPGRSIPNSSIRGQTHSWGRAEEALSLFKRLKRFSTFLEALLDFELLQIWSGLKKSFSNEDWETAC